MPGVFRIIARKCMMTEGLQLYCCIQIKAKNFLKKKDKISYKQCQLDIALPPSADSRRSVNPHPRRTEFFKKFAKGQSINSLVKLINPIFLLRITRKAKSILKEILHYSISHVIGSSKFNSHISFDTLHNPIQAIHNIMLKYFNTQKNRE